MRGFIERLFAKSPKVGLNSLSFDATSFELQGDVEGRRVWWSPDGDGVGLYVFDKRPDIPVVDSREALKANMTAGLSGSPDQSLIEFDLPTLAVGLRAVRLLFRARLPESGVLYVGTLTVPFERFSFVLKVQCPESGVTGLREAILTDRAFGQGAITFGDGGPQFGSFSPYDERYDAEFPDHPVARLRKTLRHIQDTLTLEAALEREPRLVLPD